MFIPVSGWVGDRFGTKRTFMFVFVAFSSARRSVSMAEYPKPDRVSGGPGRGWRHAHAGRRGDAVPGISPVGAGEGRGVLAIPMVCAGPRPSWVATWSSGPGAGTSPSTSPSASRLSWCEVLCAERQEPRAARHPGFPALRPLPGAHRVLSRRGGREGWTPGCSRGLVGVTVLALSPPSS